METALRHNHRLLIRPAIHRRLRQRFQPENVRAVAGASMARLGGGLALKRHSLSLASVGSIIARRRAQDPNILLCATGTPAAEVAESKGATEEPMTESLPPPPERPLPGDCCGSGCVRCVWDVYHEELHEYKKAFLDKAEPDD